MRVSAPCSFMLVGNDVRAPQPPNFATTWTCDLATFKQLNAQLAKAFPATNMDDDVKRAFDLMDTDKSGKIKVVGGTATCVLLACAAHW